MKCDLTLCIIIVMILFVCVECSFIVLVHTSSEAADIMEGQSAIMVSLGGGTECLNGGGGWVTECHKGESRVRDRVPHW